ncbi:unnamed protein product [Amoebophrya sp. A25]|nr:unnamed protein product [Amoebophrya sp. A25]|eukprot:GSA25T00026534001.1
MFHVAELRDTVALKPTELLHPEDQQEQLHALLKQKLNAKYAKKIIPQCGLGIAVERICSQNAGIIQRSEGVRTEHLVYFTVKFRLLVFRPSKGTILEVCIKKQCPQGGIRASLGDWFPHIYIPPDMLQKPCRWTTQASEQHGRSEDGAQGCWAWDYLQAEYVETTEERTDAVEEALTFEVGKIIRVRVNRIQFGVNGVLMKVICSCNGDGLGVLEWWDEDNAEEVEANLMPDDSEQEHQDNTVDAQEQDNYTTVKNHEDEQMKNVVEPHDQVVSTSLIGGEATEAMGDEAAVECVGEGRAGSRSKHASSSTKYEKASSSNDSDELDALTGLEFQAEDSTLKAPSKEVGTTSKRQAKRSSTALAEADCSSSSSSSKMKKKKTTKKSSSPLLADAGPPNRGKDDAPGSTLLREFHAAPPPVGEECDALTDLGFGMEGSKAQGQGTTLATIDENATAFFHQSSS